MSNILNRLLFLFPLVTSLLSVFTFAAQASNNNPEKSIERYTCGYYQTADDTLGFTPCWQFSLGFGVSQFSPNDESSSWDLKDDKDNSWRISASYRPFRYTWLEIVYANLGAASFENTNPLVQGKAEVSYKAPAFFVGGEYPLWVKGIDSLSVIAKVGAGSIDTESSHSLLRNNKNDNVQFAWGVGLQYHFSEHWLMRSDFESFSEDSSLVSLSVAYKWGGQSRKMYVSTSPVAEQARPLVAQTIDSDSDSDGVLNAQDRCVTSLADVRRVNVEGCVKYAASFIPLRFEHKKISIASLNEDGQGVLRHYLNILNAFPDTQVAIVGHADSYGMGDANYRTSKLRAQAVYQYLVDQGIDAVRMSVQAEGHLKPSLSSDVLVRNKAGRSTHDRRVELLTLP